eukprot:Blabericola_migrator_1__13372@NODE_94_length_14457_cov_129_345379_g84_i0_p14_GENE_NODE_94_length_14457_cov_129_345379_g84_i0NODE_94_length_14457_cov_129_345379_g84_i0_p14_ORF_typecomplete_len103_score15_84_NODE_94_length_14457_cov_129_345379_g84_i01347113779
MKFAAALFTAAAAHHIGTPLLGGISTYNGINGISAMTPYSSSYISSPIVTAATPIGHHHHHTPYVTPVVTTGVVPATTTTSLYQSTILPPQTNLLRGSYSIW